MGFTPVTSNGRNGWKADKPRFKASGQPLSARLRSFKFWPIRRIDAYNQSFVATI